MTRVFPLKDRIYDSDFTRENTGQWKPLFRHILCSVGLRIMRIYQEERKLIYFLHYIMWRVYELTAHNRCIERDQWHEIALFHKTVVVALLCNLIFQQKFYSKHFGVRLVSFLMLSLSSLMFPLKLSRKLSKVELILKILYILGSNGYDMKEVQNQE